MMMRKGLTGKPYAPDDFIRYASEVAVTDLSSFFSRYIAAREHLPAKQRRADAGFDSAFADYGGEAFISPQSNPFGIGLHHTLTADDSAWVHRSRAD